MPDQVTETPSSSVLVVISGVRLGEVADHTGGTGPVLHYYLGVSFAKTVRLSGTEVVA